MAKRPNTQLLYALAGTEQGKSVEVASPVVRAGVTTSRGQGESRRQRKMAKASRRRNRRK